MAGSVTETRLRRSLVLISRDLPTMTRRGAPPTPSDGGGRDAEDGCSTGGGAGCCVAGVGGVASCLRVSGTAGADNTTKPSNVRRDRTPNQVRYLPADRAREGVEFFRCEAIL